jgi:hypothetical protein
MKFKLSKIKSLREREREREREGPTPKIIIIRSEAHVICDVIIPLISASPLEGFYFLILSLYSLFLSFLFLFLSRYP